MDKHIEQTLKRQKRRNLKFKSCWRRVGFKKVSILCRTSFVGVKKDEKWRMYCDLRAINNVNIKYKHTIPRLDYMLDELHGSIIFIFHN